MSPTIIDNLQDIKYISTNTKYKIVILTYIED